MGRRVTVKCTECGAKHRVLKSKLGLERACPSCGVMFELDQESTHSTYDLGGGQPAAPATSTRSAPRRAPAEPARTDKGTSAPLLKRGVHREADLPRSRRRSSGSGDNPLTNPVVIVGAVIACIVVAFVINSLVSPNNPRMPPQGPAASQTPAVPQRPTSPQRTGF